MNSEATASSEGLPRREYSVLRCFARFQVAWDDPNTASTFRVRDKPPRTRGGRTEFADQASRLRGELRDLLTRIPIHEGLAELAAVEIRDKDKPILAGAIHAGCSHLVTGDKRDFGHLFDQNVQGVRIVTSRTLADELVALGLAEPLD